MVKTDPLLSIITPVYNVESYIDTCVSSIIGQSFEDWELILIDDGSTDASGNLCDKYAAKDARIRVIHQCNAGASAARNAGLDIAVGRYITFVDADDRIAPDTYESNLHYIEADSAIDMVVYPIVRDGFVHEVNVATGRDKDNLKSIFDVWYRHYPMQSSMCNKVVKRDIIGTIRFIEGKITGEDLAFASRLWDSIHHLYVSSEGAYYYNTENANSVTRCFDKKRMQEMLGEMTLFARFIHGHHELHEYAVPFFVGKLLELFKVFNRYDYRMGKDDVRTLRANRPSLKYLFSGSLKWTDGVYYSLFTIWGVRLCFGVYKILHHR